MSAEKLDWLNVMTLIGNTVNRTIDDMGEPLEQIAWHKRQTIVTADEGEKEVAAAWHYRATMQGDEPNHYAGFIPVEDVERRLFNWEPERRDPVSTINAEQMFALSQEILSGEGDEASAKILAGLVSGSIHNADSVDICRPAGALSADDPGARLGTFKKGYKIHLFKVWLLENLAQILDDDLGISAAGLLREGAQAWVEVSIPESITTPEGVTFRPNLLAGTSLDGSWATGYGRTVQVSICDNTTTIARREKGQKIKFKHTTNSLARIGEAREALAIVHTVADDFAEEVKQLTNTTVTDAQWSKFLDELKMTSRVDEKGNMKVKASLSYANNRRAELEQLYTADPRVTPWNGTAFGVLQAVNTHAHHVGVVKGMSRPMRNMDRAVSGGIDKLDTETMLTLERVLA